MYSVLVFVALAYSLVLAVPLRDSTIEELSARVGKLEETIVKLTTLVEQRSLARRNRASGDPAVSFSAVLTGPLYNIMIGQTIIFDKEFLNDGNAYNAQTGVFTAPMDGVYLFSYFVAEINNDQIVLRLVVNGQNRVDAVAEGLQDRHNDQGGNVVILKLQTGDLVRIEAYDTQNVHIDGGRDYQYTSFSGVLLYGL